MPAVLSVYQAPRRRPRVSFSREEMRQLLEVYSRRVAAGEWRDYAIDHGPDRAVFSIFRHTAETPLYSVAKLAPKAGPNSRYLLTRGREKLKQGSSLADVVAAIERRPILIASRP